MDELKKHIYDENNGLHYTLVGGYYVPDLKLSEENHPIGHYGGVASGISQTGAYGTVQFPYPDREIVNIPCRSERAGGGTAGRNHRADESHRGSHRGTESPESA